MLGGDVYTRSCFPAANLCEARGGTARSSNGKSVAGAMWADQGSPATATRRMRPFVP